MAPPELVDDPIEEILLRLPPDEPDQLVRASLVSKLWLQLLSDPSFLRRYRTFHRAPHMLGFFQNHYRFGGVVAPGFFSTTASPSPVPILLPPSDSNRWHALGCRHGRLLFDVSGMRSALFVWDPVTGDRQVLPKPPTPRSMFFTATLLCAVRGCDHLVVLVM